MRNRFFVILCCLYLQQHIGAQMLCSNPNREAGTCIPLRDCAPLIQLLATKPLTNEYRNFLARSQCSYRNNTPYVCCVPNTTTITTKHPHPNRPIQLPSAATCHAEAESFIIGGNVTGIYQHPWMALLEYKRPNAGRSFECGGVLIHPSYVLTAAHCVKGQAVVENKFQLLSVRLGEWDTSKDKDCDDEGICTKDPQNIPIAEFISHENYVPESRSSPHDIALLRLVRPAVRNDFVRPICLPIDMELRTRSFVDDRMSVVGWGRTEYAARSPVKIEAKLTGWPTDQCNQVYNQANAHIGPNQICAGGEKAIDTCSGDSGGPLIAMNNDSLHQSYYLAGITSYGPAQCGIEGWPGVYTRVGPYVDWIVAEMYE